MGIFREAMNPQILVDNQEELRLEELIDPTIVAITNRARETGMNLLNNAHNNMIDNFHSIKWLFHELEDVKDQVRHIKAMRIGMESNRKTGMADRLSLAKKRIQNLENYNHNLANQMLSMLSTINDNVTSLTSWVKDREGHEEEIGKDREEAKATKDNTFPILDQEDQKVQ